MSILLILTAGFGWPALGSESFRISILKRKKIAGFNAGRKGMVFFLIILFVKYWTVLLVFQSTLILLFRS